MRSRLPVAAATLMALMTAGCATNFNAELMRSEIHAQRGENPLAAFELNLGKFTTMLIKSALTGEDGDLPFAGIDSLHVAVYELPSAAGPAIDVTRIPVRGWEEVLRVLDENRSGMVLIQPKGQVVGDLVVVGAGPRKVIYARLKGRLNPDLPSRLGGVLREGGPEEVQRVLSELGSSG